MSDLFFVHIVTSYSPINLQNKQPFCPRLCGCGWNLAVPAGNDPDYNTLCGTVLYQSLFLQRFFDVLQIRILVYVPYPKAGLWTYIARSAGPGHDHVHLLRFPTPDPAFQPATRLVWNTYSSPARCLPLHVRLCRVPFCCLPCTILRLFQVMNRPLQWLNCSFCLLAIRPGRTFHSAPCHSHCYFPISFF